MNNMRVEVFGNRLESNIWKFYVASVLGGFAFFYNAIDTLYYRSFGLSFQQIGWIISFGLITALIMEAPTGAFADLYGKKKSLIIGSLFNFLAIACISLGSSFNIFLLGFVFGGIGRAFNSGASSALLYDTLNASGRNKEFLKHSGRLSSFFISVDIISSALAPLLFALNVRLPYFISLGAAFSVIVTQLTIAESITPRKAQNLLFENIKQIMSGLEIVLKNRLFIWLTLFNILIFTVNKVFAEMISTPFLTSYVGFSLTNLSVILTVGSLMQTGFIFFADKFENKLGPKQSFIWIVFTLPITILLYQFSRNIGLTAFLTGMYYAITSFSETLIENYLAADASSENRATILSICSLFVSLSAFIFLPFLGSVLDNISLPTGFILLAFISVIIGFLLLSRSPKNLTVKQ